MNKSLFIAGTDTDVGKTYISALFFRYLCQKRIDTGYQKWVSTGGVIPEDLLYCLGVAENDFLPELLDLQVPFRFKFPASPHFAAESEDREVDLDFILKQYQTYCENKEIVLVEGVGGVMVPLTRDVLLVDFLSQLALPTVLVARSGLGTLNHTFLSLEALRTRNIPVLGVVFSDALHDNEYPEELIKDNIETIATMGKVKVFGRVPRCKNIEEAVRLFEPIGDSLFNALL